MTVSVVSVCMRPAVQTNQSVRAGVEADAPGGAGEPGGRAAAGGAGAGRRGRPAAGPAACRSSRADHHNSSGFTEMHCSRCACEAASAQLLVYLTLLSSCHRR